MKNELLLLFQKHTDTLIEQTKSKPQENLDFKMNEQMQTFLFNPPIKLLEQGKWLLAVSYFECTNSVFIMTNGNNSFSITIPSHWETKSARKTIDELRKLVQLDSVGLHVKEVEQKSYQTKIGNKEYKSSSEFLLLDKKYLTNLKKAKNNDLEDLVYRF